MTCPCICWSFQPINETCHTVVLFVVGDDPVPPVPEPPLVDPPAPALPDPSVGVPPKCCRSPARHHLLQRWVHSTKALKLEQKTDRRHMRRARSTMRPK